MAPCFAVPPDCGGVLQSASHERTVLPARLYSESVLRDLLLGCEMQGREALDIFASDYHNLQHWCFAHGLRFEPSESVGGLRLLLLGHVISGLCIAVCRVEGVRDSSRPNTAPPGCTEISNGFRSPVEVVVHVFDQILKPDVLTTDKLLLLVIVVSPQLLLMDDEAESVLRCRVLHEMRLFRDNEVLGELSKTPELLLRDTEKLLRDKLALHTVCCRHGLAFSGSKEKLVTKLIDHLCSGSCASWESDEPVDCRKVVAVYGWHATTQVAAWMK